MLTWMEDYRNQLEKKEMIANIKKECFSFFADLNIQMINDKIVNLKKSYSRVNQNQSASEWLWHTRRS